MWRSAIGTRRAASFIELPSDWCWQSFLPRRKSWVGELPFLCLLVDVAVDDPKYQRLTRARPRARFAIISTGNSSLWLGPDHLLCIDSNGYTENYKRFYFRDIQAFIARKTDGYKYASLVLGLIGLFLGIMAAVTSDSVGRIILFSAAGLFLLCMSLNLLFGPTTLCYLQTA